MIELLNIFIKKMMKIRRFMHVNCIENAQMCVLNFLKYKNKFGSCLREIYECVCRRLFTKSFTIL